ncbi:MAG: RagB/SusD family nutrient uptake outer membrane protein [Prevotellaceae bacterium]|nr:RagB/SusD family nutrient uptake outer membrane protein [Prevotellaceae bacterium]
MKRIMTYLLSVITLTAITSCSDYLDTTPYDSLSPSLTWQTEDDAQSFLIGCYDGWADSYELLYLDCASDYGYNNFSWEGWTFIGNGLMTASNGTYADNLYDFTMIRRCNTFLANIDGVEFTDQAKKNDMIGQVKTIRAYEYFDKNWWFGGVPLIENFSTAEEAQVPRNSEEEVKQFVYDEIDEAINLLYDAPKARGYIAKGTALAVKMRSALYYGDYNRVVDAAKAIMNLGLYQLESDYANLFLVSGQDSKEIINAVQYIENLYTLYTIGQMYNNGEGGWSSIVPTQNLIDAYEMADGQTIDESSDYDPTHPFYNRDPRMAKTVVYPGMYWNGSVYNTLDQTIGGAANSNYPTAADNSSKTSLTWAKYLGTGIDYYSDMWDTNACPIIFRYAEVLLSYAEAENELNGPSATVYDLVNQVRRRAGMPDVDQGKYGTQEKLRELIRRERGVEFAGEGLRRADILRWKDSSGNILATTLMNGTLSRITGTVNDAEADETLRATVTGTAAIETRIFNSYHRYFPIPQDAIDKNPNLTQNPGY